MWYKNIVGRLFGLVTKHACDRRTDGQNYDSQDCASIAASRGNKTKVMITGERQKPVQKAGRWPCGVCGRGVGSNSIQCTSCQLSLIHI